eukprot:5329055-Prymnesium_polylepis.1
MLSLASASLSFAGPALPAVGSVSRSVVMQVTRSQSAQSGSGRGLTWLSVGLPSPCGGLALHQHRRRTRNASAQGSRMLNGVAFCSLCRPQEKSQAIPFLNKPKMLDGERPATRACQHSPARRVGGIDGVRRPRAGPQAPWPATLASTRCCSPRSCRSPGRAR